MVPITQSVISELQQRVVQRSAPRLHGDGRGLFTITISSTFMSLLPISSLTSSSCRSKQIPKSPFIHHHSLIWTSKGFPRHLDPRLQLRTVRNGSCRPGMIAEFDFNERSPIVLKGNMHHWKAHHCVVGTTSCVSRTLQPNAHKEASMADDRGVCGSIGDEHCRYTDTVCISMHKRRRQRH